MNSKLIISAIGLMAILATPAMAQKAHKRAMQPSSPTANVVDPSYGYAQGRGGDLYVEGRDIGNDPDPAIRSELLRDAPTALGAN
jgi:hypothetical protein